MGGRDGGKMKVQVLNQGRPYILFGDSTPDLFAKTMAVAWNEAVVQNTVVAFTEAIGRVLLENRKDADLLKQLKGEIVEHAFWRRMFLLFRVLNYAMQHKNPPPSGVNVQGIPDDLSREAIHCFARDVFCELTSNQALKDALKDAKAASGYLNAGSDVCAAVAWLQSCAKQLTSSAASRRKSEQAWKAEAEALIPRMGTAALWWQLFILVQLKHPMVN